MAGNELEVKRMKVVCMSGHNELRVTLPDGRELAPIQVDNQFVKQFTALAVRATPQEKL